mgnify:CR=1 FL=1
MLLITKTLASDDEFIVAHLHLKEFKNAGLTNQEIAMLLNIAKPRQLLHAHLYPHQLSEARALASRAVVPLGDAIHAILARDNDAILVSRDVHFQKLRHVVEVRRPDELL